jgi:hypothetical protein
LSVARERLGSRLPAIQGSFEHNVIKSPHIHILLKFYYFIENFNTQSLLHKMNDDNTKKLIVAIEDNDTATASSLIQVAP